jgi:hypothetical protein
VTLAARPTLTDKHHATRLSFVNEKIEGASPLSTTRTSTPTGTYYTPQFNVIHIDEKWFNMMPVKERVYCAHDEEPPQIKTRHKSHIPKVMFLAAIARPRRHRRQVSCNGNYENGATHGFNLAIDEEGKETLVDCSDNAGWYWDGKVGIFPVVEYTPAQRTSTNREKGKIEPHSLLMTAAVYEKFILEKLLLAISARCPYEMRSEKIYIQHDNAPPHKIPEEKVKQKCQQLNIDVEFFFQPAQSPDLNICDLSFFPAIQSLCYKTAGVKNNASIISAVYEAYRTYDVNKINRGFLSLMMNYNCVIEHKGSNQYKLKHMNKEKLERSGLLPTTIRVFDANNNGMEVDDGNDEIIEEITLAEIPVDNMDSNDDEQVDCRYLTSIFDSIADLENEIRILVEKEEEEEEENEQKENEKKRGKKMKKNKKILSIINL